jgi:hypothetical protein
MVEYYFFIPGRLLCLFFIPELDDKQKIGSYKFIHRIDVTSHRKEIENDNRID